MAQQASPSMAKRAYGLIADSGFWCFWYYRGQRLLVFLVPSRSVALRVYGLIGDSVKSWQWKGKSLSRLFLMKMENLVLETKGSRHRKVLILIRLYYK